LIPRFAQNDRVQNDASQIATAFAVEFPDAVGVRVDGIRPAAMGSDRELTRLRVRWRENGTPKSQLLAMRSRSRPAEVDALLTAEQIGLPAPRFWLRLPGAILFEWVEGRTFASLYRSRAKDATAELLGEMLARLHLDGGGLCHGEYGPSSVLLDNRNRPTVVGWANASKGDRAADVARAVRNVEAEVGSVLRAPFLRAYRRLRPIAPEELNEPF
jgi:tRNA A-37 threonylcarbamoyl transferase component Bud32